MSTIPEPSPEVLEVAHQRGLADGAAAVAAARAAGAVITPDSEGAAVVWEYAPGIPYFRGGRPYDAYMDAWYEVVYDALTA